MIGWHGLVICGAEVCRCGAFDTVCYEEELGGCWMGAIHMKWFPEAFKVPCSYKVSAIGNFGLTRERGLTLCSYLVSAIGNFALLICA